jgi:hypothetical protein
MNLVVIGGFLGWSVRQSDAEGVGMYPKTGENDNDSYEKPEILYLNSITFLFSKITW